MPYQNYEIKFYPSIYFSAACVAAIALKKNNFIAPFYGWGSTASRLEPLRGGSLLFTTEFPDILVLTLSTSEG